MTRTGSVAHRSLWSSVVVACVVVTGAILFAQASPHILNDRSGEAACIVSRIDGRTATDKVLVYVRAPAPPPTEVLGRLPAEKRDFSTLPVFVTLLRLTVAAGTTTPLVVRPWSLDPTLVQPPVASARGPRMFVRATFLRQQLKGGAEVIGERNALAPTGEHISSQTRCRITDADAATWR